MGWERTTCDVCGKQRSCETRWLSGCDPEETELIEVCFVCQVESERAYYAKMQKHPEGVGDGDDVVED